MSEIEIETGPATGSEIGFTVISVDDHVVEPRHLFDGRMPAALVDRAPFVKTWLLSSISPQPS